MLDAKYITSQAFSYLGMQAYRWESEVYRTALWVAIQDGRDTVEIDDVIEAIRVVRESGPKGGE